MSKKKTRIDEVLTSTEDPAPLFFLIEELAVGSYGHVYKAIYKRTNQECALKIIKLEEDDTFEEMMIEIQILEICDHANIVKYIGSWKKGDELFIAMELCTGGSATDLYQILEEPLKEPEIMIIMKESLRGLAYLHQKMIIHRDIKASNILLTVDGQVKLTDFGVSAQMNGPADKRRTFIGTPYWIAPEVVNTVIAPYDTKADLWSLGITAIELAEMAPPLHEIAPMTAVLQIPKNPPPRLAQQGRWSPEFHSFLSKCLVKDPSQRPPASELLQHPWFSKFDESSARSSMIASIREAQEAEAVYEHQKDESESEVDSDDDDDSTSSCPTPHAPLAPPPATPPRSAASLRNTPLQQQSEQAIAMQQKATGLHGSSPPPMPPTREDLAGSTGSSGGGTPPPANPFGTLDNRPGQEVARPRMTMRTLKKSNAPEEIAKGRLLRMHLKQLKALQGKLEQERGVQTKAQQKEAESLEKTYSVTLLQLHKRLQGDRRTMVKNHQTEIARIQKTQQVDRKNQMKVAGKDVAAVQKDVGDAQKKRLAEFNAQQKDRETKFKAELKSNKTMTKPAKADAQRLHKRDQDFHQLVFNESSTMHERRAESDAQLRQEEEARQQIRTQMLNLHKVESVQLRELNEFKLQINRDMDEVGTRLQKDMLAMEVKQLMESQSLQLEQLRKHHELVFAQETESVNFDEKTETAHFKDDQKSEINQLKRKKIPNKLEKKQAQIDLKRQQAEQESLFMARMQQRREKALADLRAQQDEQVQQLHAQHEDARRAMGDDHRRRELDLREQQQQKQSELALQLHDGRVAHLRRHQEDEAKLFRAHEDELFQFLEKVARDLNDLLHGLHQQQQQLMGLDSPSEEQQASVADLLQYQEQSRAELTARVEEHLHVALRERQSVDTATLEMERPAAAAVASGGSPPSSPAAAQTPRPEKDVRAQVQRMTLRLNIEDEDYSKLLASVSDGGAAMSDPSIPPPPSLQVPQH
jgi:serine/threonine protein kinase